MLARDVSPARHPPPSLAALTLCSCVCRPCALTQGVFSMLSLASARETNGRRAWNGCRGRSLAYWGS